jgi:hypothetical protein
VPYRARIGPSRRDHPVPCFSRRARETAWSVDMKRASIGSMSLAGDFVTGLLRQRRGLGDGARCTPPAVIMGSTLAGAMRHDLIVRPLVLLAAIVQMLGLLI